MRPQHKFEASMYIISFVVYEIQMSLIKLTRDINKPLHSRRDINIIYQDKALSDQTLARAKVCVCV